jgi:methylenetetrahydrofolate reductase (NADPH)
MTEEGATARCPKRMTFGPCGGVHPDGRCEVVAEPCPFLATSTWSIDPPRRAAISTDFGSAVPMIVADVRAPHTWHGNLAELWTATATALSGSIALLGEHVDNRAREDDAGAMSPTSVLSIFAELGTATIATVTGRERTLDAARSLIDDYRHAGATAIHCVTGDHPAALAFDRHVEFGAEGITLAALASELGCAVTVGESPASTGMRAARVLAKQRAGASMCILNHGGAVDELTAFVDGCRAIGVTLDFVAPIPMVADARSAGALARSPGLVLPSGYLEAIVAADDPEREALRQAAAMAARLAATGRFAGINLSGSAKDDDPWQRLTSTATFVDRVRSGWRSGSANASL